MIAELSDVLAAVCIAAAIYHYLGYPLIVVSISRLLASHIGLADREPKITFVIAAYNEESVIRNKLVNTLVLDYPREKLEIVVVADGSSDATPIIAAEFANRGVRCMFEPERRGKSHALNRETSQGAARNDRARYRVRRYPMSRSCLQ